MQDEFIGKAEAAAWLGISTRQLDRLVESRRLTKYRRTVGAVHVQYRKADLDALREPVPAEHK